MVTAYCATYSAYCVHRGGRHHGVSATPRTTAPTLHCEALATGSNITLTNMSTHTPTAGFQRCAKRYIYSSTYTYTWRCCLYRNIITIYRFVPTSWSFKLFTLLYLFKHGAHCSVLCFVALLRSSAVPRRYEPCAWLLARQSWCHSLVSYQKYNYFSKYVPCIYSSTVKIQICLNEHIIVKYVLKLLKVRFIILFIPLRPNGKKMSRNAMSFLKFSAPLIIRLFHNICLKGLYRHERLCDI